MKLMVLLLFTGVADLVLSNPPAEVKLNLKVLQPDLEAFKIYYEKTKSDIDAFIYWPNSITFHVKRVVDETQNELILKLEGNFKAAIFIFSSSLSNVSLYFKQGRFFVIAEGENKMKSINEEAVVIYEQPDITSGEEYLAIKYKGIADIKEDIGKFYTDNKDYVDTYSEEVGPLFFLSGPSDLPTNHFLEYSMRSYGGIVPGGVLSLLAVEEDGVVSVRGNHQSGRLVFNPKDGNVLLPDQFQTILPAVEDVFGVRMWTVGFLAEVKGNEVKLLSQYDLAEGSEVPPTEHSISAEHFLEKVERVEPMGCRVPADDHYKLLRPKEGKFQIYGHILTKTETMNDECPFAIKFNSDEAAFKLRSSFTNVLCTDNLKLWEEKSRDKSAMASDLVTLYYRKPAE